MVRTTRAAMLAVITPILAGCVIAGGQASANAEVLPIVFNEKSTQKLDYGTLGKPGEQVTVYGMLRNSRKWRESKQEQWLLASRPGSPFFKYSLRLANPILKLSPCYVKLQILRAKTLLDLTRSPANLKWVGLTPN